MFNLIYPNGDGTDRMIGQFQSMDACLSKAASDNQNSYTIQQMDAQNSIIMVMSC